MILCRLIFHDIFQNATRFGVSVDEDPGLTWTHFTPRSNLVTQAFVWEKVKIIYCLETIAALGLKVA